MGAEVLRIETGILHAIMRNPQCRLRFLLHCLTEMAADRIIEPDVRRVLSIGRVTWIETKKDVLWHVEGKDTDGRRLRIVVAVYRSEVTIKLITAMALKA